MSVSSMSTTCGPGQRVAGPNRVAVSVPPPTVLPPNINSTGPQRVLVADGQLSTVNNKMALGTQKVLRTASTTGPKRIAAPSIPKTVTPLPMLSRPPAHSGLKAPTKYRVGAVPTLPKLARAPRLPAPQASGIGRPRVVGSGSGSGVGNGNQEAAIRAVLVRRIAYGG